MNSPRKRPGLDISKAERTTARFLFADPSFLIGMARVLDIGGVFDDYNYSDTPEEADARAMRNDWISVGEFLSDALERTLG